MLKSSVDYAFLIYYFFVILPILLITTVIPFNLILVDVI